MIKKVEVGHTVTHFNHGTGVVKQILGEKARVYFYKYKDYVITRICHLKIAG